MSNKDNKTTRLNLRVSNDLREQIKKQAKENGFISPSGKANSGMYLRYLIKEDLQDKID